MAIVAEKAISILLDAVTSLLREKVDLILNAKDELKKLQSKLEHLEVALKDADHSPFFSSERDRNIKGELKDFFYDAQDIIEKYQTEIKLSKREKDSSTSWNPVRKLWITLRSCFKDVCASYKLSNETKKINERLDEMKKAWDMVGLLKAAPKRGGEDFVHGKHDNSQETTQHIGVQSHMSREVDKEVIVKKLLSDDSTHSSMTKKGSVSIISIVGKGGIGKTTLAKMVFSEIEQQFGERRWWVCVSERPNREDLLRKILKEVCKESKEYNNMKLSDLCTELQKELPKGKFLLVLDDVWEFQWWEEEVKRTLMGGATGSKILITSRNEYVSFGMHASYMHKLLEFNFQQSWDMFLKEALSEGQTERDLVIHNVRDVGQRLVKKCGGLPLVIKTVGSMMHTKKMSREDWKFVEDSNIWEWKMPAASTSLSKQGGHILPGLILSYDDLPYYLKSCFVYCCIFPKDYEIEKERLVMQWVAHGLIEEKECCDVEATANQYIKDLMERCLIEEIDLKKIKLHDILHDLALYVGGEEYSHASTSPHTRHMSLLAVDNVQETMHNATSRTHKLRTLLTEGMTESLPSVHLTNFKWLRVLSLRGCKMEELPKSIEYLLLLKYLDLSSSCVRRLPCSIGRLCNLQTLNLSYCYIEELPKEVGKLCNLRYLGLKGTWKLNFIAKGLGKLTNLQTLHRFLVCADKSNTRGCKIKELKDLNKLKGKLSIEGLGGTRKAIDHVGNAQLLKEKHDIISLAFDFRTIRDEYEHNRASEESGVLEALEPPLGLKNLHINDYKAKMPAWHLKTKYTTLDTLRLERCPSWEKLMSITSLKALYVNNCPALCEIDSMPALEWLEVKDCGSLEQLPRHMRALKSLKVDDLPNWEGWAAGGSGETTFTSMSCLKEADFQNCPMMQTEGLLDALSELAGHDGPATQLQKLSVWNCPSARLGWKLLEQLPNLIHLELDSESALLVPLPSQVSTFLPSLNTLKLKDNTNVDEVKLGRVPEWVWGLSQLEELYLHSFSEDISLGGHWQCLPKLKELTLSYFPNLKSLVDVNHITPQQNENYSVATTCPMDANEQIACLSKLEKLDIDACPELDLPQELRDHFRDHLGKRLYIRS